jgi:hypothetical protein
MLLASRYGSGVAMVAQGAHSGPTGHAQRHAAVLVLAYTLHAHQPYSIVGTKSIPISFPYPTVAGDGQ